LGIADSAPPHTSARLGRRALPASDNMKTYMSCEGLSVDDYLMPYEDHKSAARSALDDLALAMGQLVDESQAEALSKPPYLVLPPEPPLHRFATEHATTVNEIGGNRAL
jgi:hypothetical protein